MGLSFAECCGEDGTGFYRFSVLGLAEGERWRAEHVSHPRTIF